MTSSNVTLPARRAVVLGASNVVRGLGNVVDAARAAWGSPLDLLVAAGFGRSYGMGSRVLGRSLPSILDCGVWQALRERPPEPTAALLTDVGNDILYGASADRIVQWVEACLMRLRPHAERIVVTQLPLAGIDTLDSVRFLLVRTILFPSSRMSLESTRASAHAVNERIVAVAERIGAEVVAPDPAWYGLDPIHVHRGRRPAAWRAILGPWQREGEIPLPRSSLLRTLGLRRLRPEHRRLFGLEQRKAQPAKTLSDGSRLSLY